MPDFRRSSRMSGAAVRERCQPTATFRSWGTGSRPSRPEARHQLFIFPELNYLRPLWPKSADAIDGQRQVAASDIAAGSKVVATATVANEIAPVMTSLQASSRRRSSHANSWAAPGRGSREHTACLPLALPAFGASLESADLLPVSREFALRVATSVRAIWGSFFKPSVPNSKWPPKVAPVSGSFQRT